MLYELIKLKKTYGSLKLTKILNYLAMHYNLQLEASNLLIKNENKLKDVLIVDFRL